MIKLTSISKDGGNARVVWINPDRIISVENDDGVTMMFLTDGAQVHVAETAETVVKLIEDAE
jgi:uncharacterized protein YlzI (FlbEa/FlbD family)